MKLTTSTAVSLLLVSSACSRSEAFVPVSPGTSTHARSPSLPSPVVSVPQPTLTSTSLAMKGNLMDRFFRVFNANLNKVVSGLEDPEKVIVQAVEDMQNDLIKIRQAYAEATSSQRRLQRQKVQAEADGDSWYVRAELALRRGNEVLAREALSRRQAFVDKARGLEDQLNIQQTSSDKLYEAMATLEAKIKEAISKKQQLIARAKTAKSMRQVNDMLSGLGGGKNSMSAFVRMEEKVEALEASAEASTDMTLIPNSMESEFRLLEQSSEVENELQKMKVDLKMLSPAADKVSVSASTENERQRLAIPVSSRDGI